jgi:hypothetical protein
MPTQYVIRNEAGVLMSYIDNRMMSNITTSGGKWRTYNDTVCFEYDEDKSIDLSGFGIPFKMMLWVGYKVIPC